MKPEGAVEMPYAADLHQTSLEDALRRVMAPQIVTLVVSEDGFIGAKNVVRNLMPIGPCALVTQVNVITSHTYQSGEWALMYEDKMVWSSGA